MLTWLYQQWQALGGWALLVETFFIYLMIYYFISFCEGTRGAGILKGIALIILVLVVLLNVAVDVFEMDRIQFLLSVFMPTSITALIIILQPELRRGLVRLSQTPIFGEFLRDEHEVVDEIIKALYRLARNRVGALIAIERDDSLSAYVERGIPIDAELRSELITTVFYPGTDLHDGALIVQSGRIAAAGCLFPLSENPELGPWAGTRHRAAVGLSEETDAIAVVVSEERGDVSLCVRGKIMRKLDREELTRELRTYYAQREPAQVEQQQEEVKG